MSDQINWKIISKGFSINKNYIWLNSAGVSAPHDSFLNDVHAALDQYSEAVYFASEYAYHDIKSQIKKYLSKLLNCSPDEVTPIHNTAEGMNFAAHGIALTQGDEIILLSKEYPSNVYPWLSLESQKVKITFVQALENEADFLSLLKKKIKKQTKIISISAVHWLTGIRLPLKEIGMLCKQNNIIFVVDAAQGLGHIPLHPKEYNISFLCGSAWKWLLGPLGLGYLYISKDFIDQVEPIFWGTDSVVDSENYLPYKNEWKRGADRFCYSSTSYLDWVYFCSALRFLDTIGFDMVQKRIHSLASLLRKRLTELDFQIWAHKTKQNNLTGIIVARHSNINSTQINQHLEQKKIITALRDDGVRFSTHIMNTEDQIDECIQILRRLVMK